MSTKTHPTLSVLIPYKDERGLLTDCLESLRQMNQAVPDEILVYDDASLFPPEPFIPAGMPVRVIRGQPCLGASVARNRMLKESRCDYVHFHDADDLFSPGWTEKIRQAAGRRPDLILTEAAVMEDGRIIHSPLMDIRSLRNGKDVVRWAIEGCVLVIVSTIRREAALEAGGFDEALLHSEDFEFHIRLMGPGIRYEALEEVLVVKLNRPDSRGSNKINTSVEAVKGIEKLSACLPERYRLDLSDAAVRMGRNFAGLNAYGHSDTAFRLAEKLGPPPLKNQPALFRFAARLAGLRAAERFGMLYRWLLPAQFRESLRRTRTTTSP